MVTVLVVADDLTGANASGAMLRRVGLRPRTLLSRTASDTEQVASTATDALVIVTGSRLLPPHQAQARVAEALSGAPPCDVMVKRVDTTLRGPIAAELATTLEHRRSQMGARRVVALAVPAYPAAARTTVNGVQLVDGRPLAETAAAYDPVTPVATSRVASILTAGTRLHAAEVCSDDVRGPHFEEVLRAAVGTADIVVCDSSTDGDLARIARVAARIQAAGAVELLIVDSGPFAAAYSHALGVPADVRNRGVILAVVGTPSDTTRRQVEIAAGSLRIRLSAVSPQTSPLVAAAEAVACLKRGEPVTGWHAVPVDAAAKHRTSTDIPRILGAATARVIHECRVQGLLLCGGEAATSVLRSLGATGVDIDAEVQPLVVAGHIAGGRWAGTPVVTKGGLVGNPNAVLDSLLWLQAMSTSYTNRIERAGRS